ncbi:hypothetical protein ACFQGT_13205 [Natrialbaceae archaeon GCM10025810]
MDSVASDGLPVRVAESDGAVDDRSRSSDREFGGVAADDPVDSDVACPDDTESADPDDVDELAVDEGAN